MAGELGLLNNFRSVVWEPLNQYRGSDSTGGREIGLTTWMQKRCPNPDGGYGLKNSSGGPVTMEDVWNDLGLDPSRTTLDNLLTLSGDVKYLAPEMVREFILDGLQAKPWWDRLCASSADVTSKSVVAPWIRYDNVTPETTGEAETIGLAEAEWGEKTVTLVKKAKAIGYSDEMLYGSVMPILQPFMERLGILLAASLNTAAVATLVNGDQPSGDECAVIGTATGSTLTFADFVRAWARGSNIYYDWHTLITSEEMANTVLSLSEFKSPQGAGQATVRLESVNRVVPSVMPHFISSGVPANQALLVDPRLAMTHLQYMPLRVESERIVLRQLSATAVSITQGFSTIDRKARIILDKSKAYASYGFPSWMTPLD